jgi:hypothetical protein
MKEKDTYSSYGYRLRRRQTTTANRQHDTTQTRPPTPAKIPITMGVQRDDDEEVAFNVGS